jgi:hypothetical protein
MLLNKPKIKRISKRMMLMAIESMSGKYKYSDVVVSKVPGRVGVAALRWSVTDRRATPQMDAYTCRFQ